MRRTTFAVILTALFATMAVAQETTTGSLTGVVMDTQAAPVPGASVTLTSEQGTRTFVTDTAGRFFAPYLTPGRYSVKVELTGFVPVERRNIDVRLGQRADLGELTLRVGGVEEAVEVTATSPVVDVSSTTVGGTLDSEALRRLPVGRNFTDTLYLVPGVSTTDVGAANPSVAGGSGLENNYVVDGVNITNSGYGAVGSYSIVFGSLGTGVTTDFIKETQVKTAGFEAEYGQSTGGVVNVVTQSGTNTFHGALFGYLRPPDTEGDWTQVTTVNGTINTVQTRNADFGVSAGGPLLRDRLFVFGAFNPQFQRRTFLAPEGFPLRSLGGVDRDRTIYSYAGKLTWQMSSGHRFDASAFGDPARGDMGPQRGSSLLRTTTSGFSELKKYGGHNQVIRYDGIPARNWLIEASVARATNTIEEVPSVNEFSYNDRTVTPNVLSGGLGFYEQGNDGRSVQYQVKSTNLVGDHQIRYGVAFEDIRYTNVNQYSGPTFTLPNGAQTQTGASIQVLPAPEVADGRIYRVVRANLNAGRETKQRYLSVFLQDTWQIGRHVTFKPGLRYEQQKLIGTSDPALCHEDDSYPGANDGTGATVPCSFKWDGNWAPRVGLIVDPWGNGRAKIFANYGRFYAKIPNDLAARALSADAGVNRADYYDAALTRPVPDGTVAAATTVHFTTAGLSPSTFDPDSKSTYLDEVLGGFEWDLGHHMNFGVRYVYRNLPRVLEDVGTAPIGDYFTTDLTSVEYFITNPGPDTQTTNPRVRFEKPIHKYHAVEVTLNRAFSDNWSLAASYRWSRLRGTFEGFFRSDNGQSDPAITSLYDFPTDDPTYRELAPELGFRGDIRFQGTLGQGPLPNDRTHQVKLYGNYTWRDLNLGAGFNAGSGKPLTAMAANPVYENDGEIPEGVRGSGLATRDDGFRTRTAAEVAVDLHADWTFRVSGPRKVVLIADVFNVFDRQRPTDYDIATESTFTVLNPDFGAPVSGSTSPYSSFNAPRQVRFGARFEW